jgi:SlyX protein
MSADLLKRIETLETTVAYQEAAIEDLREALALHFREIEQLRREMNNLESSLRIVEAHPALAEPEPPPPHY